TMTTAEQAARAARVKALIDNKKTPFSAADEAYLSGQSDARLAELEAHAASQPDPQAPPQPAAPGEPNTGGADNRPQPTTDHAPAPPAPAPAPPTAPSTAAAAPKAKTEQEWMAEAPPALRSMVARAQAAETAQKAALVARLATAQKEYSA